MKMNDLIKIVLSALFFLCLLDMSYGFYQFVRFVALISFGMLALQANEKNKQTEMIVFGVLALLFQPIFKIALGRELWNIIDVAVGAGLLITVVIGKMKSQH